MTDGAAVLRDVLLERGLAAAVLAVAEEAVELVGDVIVALGVPLAVLAREELGALGQDPRARSTLGPAGEGVGLEGCERGGGRAAGSLGVGRRRVEGVGEAPGWPLELVAASALGGVDLLADVVAEERRARDRASLARDGRGVAVSAGQSGVVGRELAGGHDGFAGLAVGHHEGQGRDGQEDRGLVHDPAPARDRGGGLAGDLAALRAPLGVAGGSGAVAATRSAALEPAALDLEGRAGPAADPVAAGSERAGVPAGLLAAGPAVVGTLVVAGLIARQLERLAHDMPPKA